MDGDAAKDNDPSYSRLGTDRKEGNNGNADRAPASMMPEEIRDYMANRGDIKRNSRTVLEILEGRHTLSLLVYVDSACPVMKSDIYNNVSRSGNMAEKIDDLVRLGLLNSYETGKPNSQIITVTRKGHETAELLRSIVDILEDKE